MIKYISKLFDYTDEEKSAISSAINRQNKQNAIKNIEWMQNAGLSFGFIGRAIKEAPTILTLDTNPNNPSSLEYKSTFYSKFNITKTGMLVSPKLCTYDIYEDSNVIKVLQSLSLYGFSNNEIGKILIKCPKILELNANDDSVNGLSNRIEFFKDIANSAEVDFKKLILRSPYLLSYSIDPNKPDSIFTKLNYFKARFNLDDKQIAKQIYKFPNFLGLDIDEANEASVDAKAKKLNELGLADNIIGLNLKVLGAPINKVKLRYIICKNFGMSDSVFINNKFMIAEAKLYARAQYLTEHYLLPKSLIYGTESEFSVRTGKYITDIIKDYPLTIEAAKWQEQVYNSAHNIKLTLSSEELDSINTLAYEERGR